MSSPIQRSSFNSDLLPIINSWHGDDLKLQENLVSKICEVESSDAAFEVHGVLTGMSTLQSKDEQEAIKYDTSRQNYTPRFNHKTWALGFKITMEMMQDGRAMKDARRFVKMLTKAASETKNILAANVYNNGYTSGKTQDGGDGVILFSASHPTSYGNQSNTQAVSADLSEAGLEDLIIQIRNARDDRGLRANLKPRKILVNVAQGPELTRILKSDLRVSTADNDLNYVKQSGAFPDGMVETPYITDTDAVFILTDCMDGVKFYNRYDSAIENDNVFDTKNACYSKIVRCSQGWINWRGVYATPGV